MIREYDTGSIFSRYMMVSEATEFLKQGEICIVDIASDALKDIDSILRRLDRGYLKQSDYILRNQIAKTTEDSNTNNALDEFLSTFTVLKTPLEVN